MALRPLNELGICRKGVQFPQEVRLGNSSCTDNQAMQHEPQQACHFPAWGELDSSKASLVFPYTSQSPDKGDASKENPNLHARARTEKSRQRYRRDRKKRHRKKQADKEKAQKDKAQKAQKDKAQMAQKAQMARRTEEEGRQTCRRAAKASPRLCRAALSTRVFTAFTPCLKK